MINLETIKERPTASDLIEGTLGYRYLYFSCPKCGVLNTRRMKTLCHRTFDSVMGIRCHNCHAQVPDMERMSDQIYRRLTYHRAGR
jgi:phage FluMu protein Com